MIFWIAKLIAGLFGWDITKVQKYVILAFIALIACLVIAFGLWVRSCRQKRAFAASQAQVAKINAADEKARKAELGKVITDNAETVKTVDQRNTIAEVNETEKNAQINAKIAEADEKIVAAKSNGKDVTGPQLECLLTNNCQ